MDYAATVLGKKREISMVDESSDKYRAPALEKGLDILEFLARTPTGLSQAEIAKGLGRSANEIFRMLDTLVRRKYVTRSSEGDRYLLSLKILNLANIHPPSRRLLDIAEPTMRKLSIETEQSCHLAVWEDGGVVISSSFSAPGNWRFSLRPGAVVGLYNTGSGLVLAAFQDKKQRSRMFRDHQFVSGERKIPDPELEPLLDKICEQGYFIGASKTVQGATNLAFPILNSFGHACACLTCPFIERIDVYQAPKLAEVLDEFQAAAKEIEKQVNGTA